MKSSAKQILPSSSSSKNHNDDTIKEKNIKKKSIFYILNLLKIKDKVGYIIKQLKRLFK